MSRLNRKRNSSKGDSITINKNKKKSVSWEATTIDSPLDFVATSVQSLESSLRCPICGELFQGPVILTSCSHSFCSRCLRESLSEKATCPECYKEANEGQIRKNIVLERIVLSWIDARPTLLELQSQPVQSTSTSASPRLPTSAPPTPSIHSTNTKAKRKGKERDLNQSEEIILDSSDVEVVEDDDLNVKSRRTRGGRLAASTMNGKKKSLDDPDMIVTCPICSHSLKNSEMDHHITHNCIIEEEEDEDDSIGGRKKAAARGQSVAWSKLMPNTREDSGKSSYSTPELDMNQKLPLVSYANMKLKDLKSLLESHHLPLFIPQSPSANASTPISIFKERHRKFLTIWNANIDVSPLDSRKLKTFKEVLEKVREWEKVRWEGEEAVGGGGEGGEGGEEKGRMLPGKGEPVSKEYEEEHESEFKRLIALARQSMKSKSVAPPPVEPSSTIEPDSYESEKADDTVPGDTLKVQSDHDGGNDLEGKVEEEEEDDNLHHGDFSPRSSSPSHSNSERKRKRSLSPFNPEGPRPSQRVREQDLVDWRMADFGDDSSEAEEVDLSRSD